MSEFYIISGRKSHWGDYFDILMHGMTDDLGRRGGLLELERTGPFVPPISMPSSVLVVTESFRSELENSGLVGLRFQPVIKRRIVPSAWHTWDRNTEHPAEYPEETEPENYIVRHRHSATVSRQLVNCMRCC